MRKADPDAPTRGKLLDAAQSLMMERGYAATSVSDICARAGATNGSFFHFFGGKEDIGRAAVARFIERELAALDRAPFRRDPDPAMRLRGWIDAAAAVFSDPRLPKSCLLGTMTQELAPVHPRFQALFAELFSRWAAGFSRDAAEALAARGAPGPAEAAALADMYLSIIQGSIILVKGRGDPGIGARNLLRFGDYLETRFGGSARRRRGRKHA